MRAAAILCAALSPALGSCGSIEPPSSSAAGVGSITIQAGHYAHRTFYSDGWVEGGHTSHGPENPVVSEERERIAEGQVEAIWRAAAALPRRLRGRREGPRPHWERWMQLRIRHADGVTTQLTWPAGTQYPDERVQELLRLLSRHRTGCW